MQNHFTPQGIPSLRESRCRLADDSLRFTFDRAELDDQAKSTLDAIAENLKVRNENVDHVARLVGVESVGIGSDLSIDAVDAATGKSLPSYDIAGVSPPTFVFQLTDGLIRRGYTNRQIELILGGNFLRALAWIWPDEPVKPPTDPWLARCDPFCPPVPLDG